MESEHRRGERNRRQTGSMYTPAYRVLVSSEFTEGSFIPRQTGIVCASGQTTWTPECQVLVSSKFREGSFIPRQTGIACAGEQQTRVTSAYLATLQTRPNPSTVGLPAPPPTAPCACAPLAAPPPARMPCCRPPAYHFPHRCPTRPPRPACVRSLPMRPHASADTALHRAAARAPPHRRLRGRHADARMRPTSHTAARPRSRPASLAARHPSQSRSRHGPGTLQLQV